MYNISDLISAIIDIHQPFLDITTNPSWEIARQLPSSLIGEDGQAVNIVVPPEYTPAAYHKICAQVEQLIEQHNPDLIIHMGLDVDSPSGVFKIERSALRDGYHDIPDIDRKVFTRAENKKVFAKASSSFVTTLDIDSAFESWNYACSSFRLPRNPATGPGSKKNGKETQKLNVTVQLSDDVGTYVCGFQYYCSMLELQKKAGKRNAVFFHVPKLDNEEEIRVGLKVTEELIRALVAVAR